nr:MAG TPA: MerF protein, mercury transporter, lipid [Caudoviricetes sp.]
MSFSCPSWRGVTRVLGHYTSSVSRMNTGFLCFLQSSDASCCFSPLFLLLLNRNK